VFKKHDSIDFNGCDHCVNVSVDGELVICISFGLCISLRRSIYHTSNQSLTIPFSNRIVSKNVVIFIRMAARQRSFVNCTNSTTRSRLFISSLVILN
jgi:hypothetical protein